MSQYLHTNRLFPILDATLEAGFNAGGAEIDAESFAPHGYRRIFRYVQITAKYVVSIADVSSSVRVASPEPSELKAQKYRIGNGP